MNTLNINTESSVLFIATLLTGLSAGLCFIWTNTITPGIGRLDDIGYLQAFQQMNRTIINPSFFIVFIGPLFIMTIATILNRSGVQQIFYLLMAATIIYFVGLFLITVYGNVPLNVLLDKANLTAISIDKARGLRTTFENKWNNLHLIRTISSFISFTLLLLVWQMRSNISHI